MPDTPQQTRRSLPSVDRVVRGVGVTDHVTREVVVTLARDALAVARAEGAGGELETIVKIVTTQLARLKRPRLEPVINATGVILHTNLGRAPVSAVAALAMADAASGYVPLEIEPDTNARGGRMREISTLMLLLCGAERTLVVNNNAGALLLTLAGLAAGGEVIVSRGEAVEIGGGFRIPDVVVQGGARLVDVGTTNKTRVADYAAAVGPSTRVLLKVHPSNFVVEGFTEEASAAELAALGRTTGVPFVHDIGSGALIDPATLGLGMEPTFQAAFSAGVDVVTASGDKLLGGPQSGIICGRADLVERIERHPLARALRADKATLAGLAATLRHYVAGDALEAIPVWRMMAIPLADLDVRAIAIAAATGTERIALRSTIGGGSLPGEEIASIGVAVTGDAEVIAAALRRGDPRVFGRIDHGRLLLDLRTVHPDQDRALTAALRVATGASGG